MANVTVFRAEGETLERLPIEASTLDEATIQTGHGTYCVFRLYPGPCVLRLDSHLNRTRRSAEALGKPFSHSNEWLRAALRRAVRQSGFTLSRIRLTVPYAAPGAAVIALEPFAPPPPEVFERGVRVGLASGARARPEVKDSRFVEQRLALQQSQSGVYEILLADEAGRILEGTGSNFYAVLGGALRTAGEGVLQGITRSLLLEVAPRVLPVVLEPVTTADLPSVDEAMITSSSRGVVPVVQIGDSPVGSGVPGPLSARLRAEFDAQVEAELEPL